MYVKTRPGLRFGNIDAPRVPFMTRGGPFAIGAPDRHGMRVDQPEPWRLAGLGALGAVSQSLIDFYADKERQTLNAADIAEITAGLNAADAAGLPGWIATGNFPGNPKYALATWINTSASPWRTYWRKIRFGEFPQLPNGGQVYDPVSMLPVSTGAASAPAQAAAVAAGAAISAGNFPAAQIAVDQFAATIPPQLPPPAGAGFQPLAATTQSTVQGPVQSSAPLDRSGQMMPMGIPGMDGSGAATSRAVADSINGQGVTSTAAPATDGSTGWLLWAVVGGLGYLFFKNRSRA